MEKLDNLFKDRLESHSLPVESEAWNVLEARLEKKKLKPMFYWVAASVSIVMLATIALLSDLWNSTSKESTLVSIKKPMENTIPKESETNTIPKKEQVLGMDIARVSAPEQKPTQDMGIRPSDTRPTTPQIPIHTFSTKQVILETEQSKAQRSLANTHEPKTKATYTAIYKPSRVDESKTKFIEKVWAKAIDFKNGELDWSLRTAKNDLIRRAGRSN